MFFLFFYENLQFLIKRVSRLNIPNRDEQSYITYEYYTNDTFLISFFNCVKSQYYTKQ